MPMPKPKKGETEKEFIQRFMANEEMQEYNNEQRLAIAYSEWRKRHNKKCDIIDLEASEEGDNISLEYKELEIKVLEVKMDGDKGKATILLSPFDNIDYGNDRVKSSISKRNDKKRVPLLLQHKMATEHGHLDLFSDKEGIKAHETLYLETTDKGIPIFPEAHKHYALLKRAENNSGVSVKYSIGYNTLDYSYVTEKGKTVRDLKDIDIMEGSRVTFPMNGKAENIPGSVKSLEGGVKMEEKALGFADILKLRNANEMRWKLTDALHTSLRQLIEDETMTEDQKITQLNVNVDEFSAAYKQNMSNLIKVTAKNKTSKKSVLDNFEVKEENHSTETKEHEKQEEEKSDIIDIETKGIEDLYNKFMKDNKGV